MSFAFDISYKLTGNINDDEELEMRIFHITKSYISCTWYAADCDGISKNLGFQIPMSETESLEEIINKVKSTPNIYIDFIVFGEVDIYRSPLFLSRCPEEYRLEYKRGVEEMIEPLHIRLNKMCNQTR